jgi:hypothetical protein
MRRMGIPAAMAAAGCMLGCAADVDRPANTPLPAGEGPVGLFVLETDLGPVDVLSFHDDEGGVRTVRVHRITPIGDHETSAIRVVAEPGPAGDEDGVVSYALVRGGTETCRLTRRISEGSESEVDLAVRAGGDALTVRATRAEGGVLFEVAVTRGGTRTAYSRFLDRRRAAEPGYVEGIRNEIRAFYPDGPLTDPDDLNTLYSVVGSSDWENHLVVAEGTGGGTPDPGFAHRMRVGCTIAGVSGKLTCFAAKFTAWAWLPCIVAEGVNLACLTYNIKQLIDPDAETEPPAPPPPPPPCGCPCGCD